MNQRLLGLNLQLYQKNPENYTEEEVDNLEQQAGMLGLPFKRNEEATVFNLTNTVTQLFTGFTEGLTTLPVNEWLRLQPKNAAERIAYQLGSLMGFIGAIPGPGLLGKVGMSKMLKGLKIGEAAGALERLPKALHFKSVPMYIADKAMGLFSKTGLKAGLEANKYLKEYPIVPSMIEGALHLGVASGIGAAPIYDLSPQTFIDQRLAGIGHGALYGVVNRAIGNIFTRGGKFDLGAEYVKKTPAELRELYKVNPKQAAELMKTAESVNKVARAVSSSLFFGMPSTIQGLPLELQIYEYVINAYFGQKELSYAQRKALEVSAPFLKGKGGLLRSQLMEPDKYIKDFNKLPKEVQDELFTTAEFELGGKLGRLSRSEYAVYSTVEEVMARLKTGLEEGKLTPEQAQDYREAVIIQEEINKAIVRTGDEEKGVEEGTKLGVAAVNKENDEIIYNYLKNEQLAGFVKSIASFEKMAAETMQNLPLAQAYNDLSGLYKEKGLQYYKNTFDAVAEELSRAKGLSDSAEQMQYSFDIQKKLIDIAGRMFTKGDMRLKEFKKTVQAEIGYDIKTNPLIDRRVNRMYIVLRNAKPRAEGMIDESGNPVEPSDMRPNGQKRIVTVEPPPVINEPGFLDGTFREYKTMIDSEGKERPIQEAVELGLVKITSILNKFYDKGIAFYAGKKADSNLGTGKFLLSKEEVPGYLEKVFITAAPENENVTIGGMHLRDIYNEALNRWVAEGGREDVFKHLYANNIELIRKTNFGDRPIEEVLPMLGDDAGADFLTKPASLNKRAQLLMAFEPKVSDSDFLDMFPDMPEKARILILNGINKDGSPHGQWDKDYTYLVPGEDGPILKRFKEYLDGGRFVRRKVYQAFQEVSGLDPRAGTTKGTQEDFSDKILGGLLEKFAYHEADEALDKWMEANNVDIISFDTTAKQKGFRESSDWWFDDKGINIKNPAMYQSPWSTFSFVMAEDSGKMGKGTLWASQVGTNISDPKVARQHMRDTVTEYLNGDEETRSLYNEYIDADEPAREAIFDKIDVGYLGIVNKINILKGPENSLKAKLIKDIIRSDEDLDDFKEGYLEGVYDQETEAFMGDYLKSQGAAQKILTAANVTPAVLQLPGIKSYWNTAISKYLLSEVISPKTKYGSKAAMKPHSPYVMPDNKLERGTYLLGEGFREQPVKDMDGKATTLGELWEKHKVEMDKPEVKEHFRHVLARIPADARASVRVMQFKGFAKGQRGYGVILHPEDMQMMGGADTDYDTSFIYYNPTKSLKDYYAEHQDQWKDKDGVITEPKTALDAFMHESQPKAYPFDPYSIFEMNTAAYNGNMLLGQALAFSNRMRTLLRWAKERDIKTIYGLRSSNALSRMQEDELKEMIDAEYNQRGLPVDKEGKPVDKFYKEVKRQVEKNLKNQKTATGRYAWRADINFDNLERFEQLIREAINFAADSADGIRIKPAAEIKRYMLDTILKNVEINEGAKTDKWRKGTVYEKEEYKGHEYYLVNENKNPVIAQARELDNIVKNRNIERPVPWGGPGKFTLDEIALKLRAYRERFPEGLPSTNYLALLELSKYDLSGANAKWRGGDNTSDEFLKLIDKVFYESGEKKSPYAVLVNEALGRPVKVGHDKKKGLNKWRMRQMGRGLDPELLNLMEKNTKDEFYRNDLMDTISAFYVIDKYNKLVGYTDKEGLGLKEYRGVVGYKKSDAQKIRKFVEELKKVVESMMEGRKQGRALLSGLYVDAIDGKVKYEPGREKKTGLEVIDALINEYYNSRSKIDPSVIPRLDKISKIKQDLRDLYPLEREYMEALTIASLRPKTTPFETIGEQQKTNIKRLMTEAAKIIPDFDISDRALNKPENILNALRGLNDQAAGKIADDLEGQMDAYREATRMHYESDSNSSWYNRPYISPKSIAEFTSMFSRAAELTRENVPSPFLKKEATIDELNRSFSKSVTNDVIKIDNKIEQVDNLQTEFLKRRKEAGKTEVLYPGELEKAKEELAEFLYKHPYMINRIEDTFASFSEWFNGIPKDFTDITMPELKAFVKTLKELDSIDPNGYSLKKRHYFFKPEWLAEAHQKYDKRTTQKLVLPVLNPATGKILKRMVEVPMSYMKQLVIFSHKNIRNTEEALDEEKERYTKSPVIKLLDAIQNADIRSLAFREANAERESRNMLRNTDLVYEDKPEVKDDGRYYITIGKGKSSNNHRYIDISKLSHNDKDVLENQLKIMEMFEGLPGINKTFVIEKGVFNKEDMKTLAKDAPATYEYLEGSIHLLDGDAFKQQYQRVRQENKELDADNLKLNITATSGPDKGKKKEFTYRQIVEMIKTGMNEEFEQSWNNNVLGAYKDSKGEIVTDFDKILKRRYGKYLVSKKRGYRDDVPDWMDVNKFHDDFAFEVLNKGKIPNYGINLKNYYQWMSRLMQIPFRDTVVNDMGLYDMKKASDFKTFEEQVDFLDRVWNYRKIVDEIGPDGKPILDDKGKPRQIWSYVNRERMAFKPYGSLTKEQFMSYFPHRNHPKLSVEKMLRRRILEEQDPDKRRQLEVQYNRDLDNNADLSEAIEADLEFYSHGVTETTMATSSSHTSRNLKPRDMQNPIPGWTLKPGDVAAYNESLVKEYYQGMLSTWLNNLAINMEKAILADKTDIGKGNAKYWKAFLQASIRNILGYPANYPAEWLKDPGYKISGNPYHLVTENYWANKSKALDKFWGITEKMRQIQPVMVPKMYSEMADNNELLKKFGTDATDLYRFYALRDEAYTKSKGLFGKKRDKQTERVSKLSKLFVDKRGKMGLSADEAKQLMTDMNRFIGNLPREKRLKQKIDLKPVLDEQGLPKYDEEGRVVYEEQKVFADVYKGVRESLVSRKLASLANAEGKWNMMTLLFHPKTAGANLLTAYQNTLVSTGSEYFRKARDMKYLATINPDWTSKANIEADIDRVGGIENYFKYEMSLSQRFTEDNAKRFMERAIAKIKENPNVDDSTLYEMAKQEGLTQWFVDKGAFFIKKSERMARRHAWLAHYLKARDVFEATKDWDWHDPWLVEMANRGVQATQFLYHNAARPEFMRTSLGKIAGRFQMFALSSLNMRYDIAKKAQLMGYAKGSEQYERMERMMTADMFMLALASVLPFSIFNTTLSPPMNYLQDFAQYLFGSGDEKERAFFGVLPYPLNIVQPVLPPSSRVITSTLNLLLSGDVEKFAGYQMWTFFPFGRIANDLRKSLDNPQFFTERILGVPYNTLVREIDRSKKIQEKRETAEDKKNNQDEAEATP